MKRKLFFLVLVGMMISIVPFNIYGSNFLSEVSKDNTVTLYFFHGDGCPHCEEEMKWLNDIAIKYSNLVIKGYEVWYDEENNALMEEVKERLNVTSPGVPFTVIGDKHFLGFNHSIGNSMETQIRFCSKHTYHDLVKAVIEDLEEVQVGEELESMEETKKNEVAEEQKIFESNMKANVLNPFLIVLGVGALCGAIVYSIYVVKKKG